MLAQPVRDTSPELRLRRALHRLGLRYRLHQRIVPGTRRSADITFSRPRIAVMVDGCFWHGCAIHKPPVKANAAWWAAKLETTRARDADTDARLQSAGWTVVRVWEHEDPEVAADAIYRLVHPT